MIDETSLPVTARVLKKRKGRTWIWACLLGFVVLGIASSFVYPSIEKLFRRSSNAAVRPAPVKSQPNSAQHQAIRDFLVEYLDSGQWEEIRWYPPKSSHYRLKLRTKSKYGSDEVLDLVFAFNGDRLTCYGNQSYAFRQLWDGM